MFILWYSLLEVEAKRILHWELALLLRLSPSLSSLVAFSGPRLATVLEENQHSSSVSLVGLLRHYVLDSRDICGWHWLQGQSAACWILTLGWYKPVLESWLNGKTIKVEASPQSTAQLNNIFWCLSQSFFLRSFSTRTWVRFDLHYLEEC